MEEIHKLRGLFLELFVREIIGHIEPTEIPIGPVEFKIDRFKPIPKQRENKMQKTFREGRGLQTSMFKPTSEMASHLFETKGNSVPQSQQVLQIQSALQTPKSIAPPPPHSMGINPDLRNLNSLIADPGVQLIECIGEGKNILVRKNGMVQRTQMMLSKEDIAEIIMQFSQATRIPVLQGVFKAAAGNLLMTAVISDATGNRFVLQKRGPTRAVRL